ncbi:hypothetical protein PCANC_06577 [Puccinia coronata f. sp. avenae]|nr:hypothetical protein PCANC_06577 [Puccinia coronata f. sp. avenae]
MLALLANDVSFQTSRSKSWRFAENQRSTASPTADELDENDNGNDDDDQDVVERQEGPEGSEADHESCNLTPNIPFGEKAGIKPPKALVCRVWRLLISNLPVRAGVTGPRSSATTSNLVTSASGNKLEKTDEHQVASSSHACFIMSGISELLASYTYKQCKISFMSTRHCEGKWLAKSSTLPSSFGPTDVKSKHQVLNFMLCDLIPTGPLSQPNTTESRKKSAISTLPELRP